MTSVSSARPHITPEIRAAYDKISTKQWLEWFKSKGVKASLRNSKNKHFLIKGTVREVSIYATSGTVTAGPTKQMGSINVKGMMPERALERAVAIANFGH